MGAGNGEWRDVVAFRYAGDVMRRWARWSVLLVAATPALACRAEREEASVGAVAARGEAAPPARCRAPAPANEPEELAWLPRKIDGYCIDAHADIRAHQRHYLGAAGASGASEVQSGVGEACQRLLGAPLCERYEQNGLARLVSLRYVPEGGGEGALEVSIVRLGSSLSSFALFSELVQEVGSGEQRATALDELGTAIALGNGGLGWRGAHLLRASYSDPDAATPRARARARELSARLFEHVRAALPDAVLPRAVQSLPAAGRVPLSARYLTGELFGAAGVRGAAEADYEEGPARWRLRISARADADAAEDVLRTLLREPTAYRLQNAPLNAIRLREPRGPGEPPVDWVVAQKGAFVYALGDAPPAASGHLNLWQKLDKLVLAARGEDGAAPREAAPEPAAPPGEP